jgi:hypothetical protein
MLGVASRLWGGFLAADILLLTAETKGISISIRKHSFLSGFVFQHAHKSKGKAIPSNAWTGSED